MAYKNYKFTPQVKKDIDQAIDYIVNELGDVNAAKKLFGDILKTIERICLFPESCEAVDNKLIKNKNVRRALVNNYLLFYILDYKNSAIIFIRFIYGRRSIIELLKEVSL